MSRPQTLHPAHQHPAPRPGDDGGWIGVDRGLSVFLVAADPRRRRGARVDDAPRALGAGLKHERRLAKSLSRKKKGSHNRRDAAAKLGRHHHRVANVRRHFLHQVSNALVKTHDRLVIENLNIAGMLANSRLARAVSDAGWAEFARQLRYKQAWRCGELAIADRWYPSSKLCPQCGAVQGDLSAGRQGLQLRMWTLRRSRPQRRGQSRPLGPGPSRLSPIPGPPSTEAGPPTPADGTALTSTPRGR